MKSVKTALESARASAAAAVPTQKIVMEKVYSSWEAIAAQPTGAHGGTANIVRLQSVS